MKNKNNDLFNKITKVVTSDDFSNQIREFGKTGRGDDITMRMRDIVSEKTGVEITSDVARQYAINMESDNLAKTMMDPDSLTTEDVVAEHAGRSLLTSAEYMATSPKDVESLVIEKLKSDHADSLSGFINANNLEGVVDVLNGLDTLAETDESRDVSQMSLEEAEDYCVNQLAYDYEFSPEAKETISEYGVELSRFYKSYCEEGSAKKALDSVLERRMEIDRNAAVYRSSLLQAEKKIASGEEVPDELSERVNRSGDYLLDSPDPYAKQCFEQAHKYAQDKMEHYKPESQAQSSASQTI